jgi:hypothetical protein
MPRDPSAELAYLLVLAVLALTVLVLGAAIVVPRLTALI